MSLYGSATALNACRSWYVTHWDFHVFFLAAESVGFNFYKDDMGNKVALVLDLQLFRILCNSVEQII